MNGRRYQVGFGRDQLSALSSIRASSSQLQAPHGCRYEAGSRENPTGPKGGEAKIVRGGSWVNDARYLRVAGRYRNEPEDRNDYVGFRCAREV